VEVDFFPEIDYFLKSTKSRDLFLCVDFNRLFWGGEVEVDGEIGLNEIGLVEIGLRFRTKKK
jgi:hypothetical protein